MAIFLVNGQEHNLTIVDQRGIDYSSDFVGNTAHGMGQDEDGRFLATTEDLEWWQRVMSAHEHMDDVIADYVKKFGRDEVNEVVQTQSGGYDLEYLPNAVISALAEAFG